MNNKKEWLEVDIDLFFQMLQLHNAIVANDGLEAEFDSLVMANEEKIKHPEYLVIFAERVELFDDYFMDHFEMCKVFYDFMKNNPEWVNHNFNLRTSIRLGMFEDLFEKYLRYHDYLS